MKKVITALVIFILVFFLTPFIVNAKTLPESSNTQYPVLIKETTKTISFSEIISGLEKTEGLNRREAIRYIVNKEKAFEKLHPELFASRSDISSGHYEYMQLSHYEGFGEVYWESFGMEQSGQLVIQQSVYAEVYVDGSFRQFVWVGDPFTTPGSGGYTWHPTYNHTRQDSPTQFTAMSSGYAEVAIGSTYQFSIGVDLEGAGFSFSYSSGSTYYYRKTCNFPIWTYNLYSY